MSDKGWIELDTLSIGGHKMRCSPDGRRVECWDPNWEVWQASPNVNNAVRAAAEIEGRRSE